MSISVGGLILLFLALGVAAAIWWVVRLIECCTLPEAAWRAVGQNRLAYLLLMIFLGLLGTFAYAVGPRRELLAARDADPS